MKEEMNNEELRVNSTERKRSEGITLIALVITIILLLILAVVSIQIITNQGIITHAESAGTTYTEEQEKELISVAYSKYRMTTYAPETIETTPDFEKLKETFKEGTSIESIWDEENSESGTVAFINGIVCTEEDCAQDDEKQEEYFTIHYNGYQYLLTFGYNGLVKSFKIIRKETLEIPDANVTGSEKNAWDIEFIGSKNKYVVLPNGKIIPNRWWELTDEEKQQLITMPDTPLQLAAMNSNEMKLAGISNSYFREQPEDMLTVMIVTSDRKVLFL